MDHSHAPVLEALADYHRAGQTPFTPPGHKQARGADPRVRAVLGDAVFCSDVLAVAGLDDRTANGRVLERAQELMADAVHAKHTFFSWRATPAGPSRRSTACTSTNPNSSAPGARRTWTP